MPFAVNRNTAHEVQKNTRTKGPLSRLEVMQLFAMRILSKRSDVLDNFMSENGFSCNSLAELLGLRGGNKAYNKQAAIKAVQASHPALEARYRQHGPDPYLRENFSDLATFLNVNSWEALLYRALDQIYGFEEDLLVLDIDTFEAPENSFFPEALDISESEAESLSQKITAELKPLHKLADGGAHYVGANSPFFSKRICKMLCESRTTLEDIMEGSIRRSSPPELTVADYGHIKEETHLLVRIMRGSRDLPNDSTNIFLHGPPGTGKTQLARLVSKEADIQLFELLSACPDGRPFTAADRLERLYLASKILSGPGKAILCDECEHLFARGLSLTGEEIQKFKGTLHAIMEEAGSTIIWIANDTRPLTDANSRRFVYCMECPIPPESSRRKIVKEALGECISPALQSQLAKCDNLSPAILQQTAKTLQRLRPENGVNNTSENDQTATLLLNGTLKVIKQRPIRPRRRKNDNPYRGVGNRYNPEFLNANADLEYLAKRLKKEKRANICISGPPGTGKTSWAHYLAHKLGQRLVIKKASDILDKWVGGTEQRIAQAFETANIEGSILLIDEVDTLISDRKNHNRTWETSRTNEMLTQMETFDGIFIGTTNRFRSLDAAVQRRFSMKLVFDYLNPEQALNLFRFFCRKYQLGQPDKAQEETILSMDTLTPGDFDVIEKESRLRPLDSCATAIDWLASNQALKPVNRRKRNPVGF